MHDIIEINAILRHETERGYLLTDGDVIEWVPKSLVEDNKDGSFSMPEWLAMEKGFI